MPDVDATRARLQAIAQERGERLVVTNPSPDGDGVFAALEGTGAARDGGLSTGPSAKGPSESDALASLLHVLTSTPSLNPELTELVDLEHMLRGYAFVLNAELVVDKMPDGKLRAAFVDPNSQRMGQPGLILQAAEARDRRAALEALRSLATG